MGMLSYRISGGLPGQYLALNDAKPALWNRVRQRPKFKNFMFYKDNFSVYGCIGDSGSRRYNAEDLKKISTVF